MVQQREARCVNNPAYRCPPDGQTCDLQQMAQGMTNLVPFPIYKMFKHIGEKADRQDPDAIQVRQDLQRDPILGITSSCRRFNP